MTFNHIVNLSRAKIVTTLFFMAGCLVMLGALGADGADITPPRPNIPTAPRHQDQIRENLPESDKQPLEKDKRPGPPEPKVPGGPAIPEGVTIPEGPPPELEIVRIEKKGPAGASGEKAHYGKAYLLDLIVRNNNNARSAKFIPAYTLGLGKPHKARFGAFGSGGVVEIGPNETKRVKAYLDFRKTAISKRTKRAIRRSGQELVEIFLAKPDPVGPDKRSWIYDDRIVSNHQETFDLLVMSRFNIQATLTKIQKYGDCKDKYENKAWDIVFDVHLRGEDTKWSNKKRVDYGRHPRTQHDVGLEDHLYNVDSNKSIYVEIWFVAVKSGLDDAFGLAYRRIDPAEWNDEKSEYLIHDEGTRGCDPNVLAGFVEITTEMKPYE